MLREKKLKLNKHNMIYSENENHRTRLISYMFKLNE